MNYTKGEWKAQLRDRDNCFRITSLPEGTFQTIQIAEVFGTHGDDLANAHLISASPEMYEACHKCLALLESLPAGAWDRKEQKLLKDIKQSLAKAEGKETK